MRGIIFIVFLGFIGPVSAITKCELNGKVIYKTGSCPKNATTKFLVKGNYVAEQRLQERELQRAQESNSAFEKLNVKTVQDESLSQDQLDALAKQREANIVEMSDESGHFQLRKANEPESKPAAPDISNDEWLEMERQLDESEKALQQLQNQ